MPKALNKDPIAFSARLNEAMDDMGVPRRGRVADLARRYDVSQPTASAWLNGGHLPEPDKARRLANEHRVSFYWLYMGTGEKNDSDNGGKPKLDGHKDNPTWANHSAAHRALYATILGGGHLLSERACKTLVDLMEQLASGAIVPDPDAAEIPVYSQDKLPAASRKSTKPRAKVPAKGG